MPSVFVEAGFMTNSKEGAYLNSKKGQNEEIADQFMMPYLKHKNP